MTTALSEHIEQAIREYLGAPSHTHVSVDVTSQVVHDCDMCGIETEVTVDVYAFDYENKKRNKPAPSWYHKFADVNEMLNEIFSPTDHRLQWHPGQRPFASCTCGGWAPLTLLDNVAGRRAAREEFHQHSAEGN